MSTGIESVLQENRVFPPAPAFVQQANISGMDAYRKLCAEAERDFEGFWARLAREELLWHKPFTKVLDESNAPFFKWFEDGELNASYNSLDRHLKTQPDKTAIVFEADDGQVTRITYKELHRRVCMAANGLKSVGIRKGDRVLIYMPMSVEVVVAMQACARIGAVHSVVFGGFRRRASTSASSTPARSASSPRTSRCAVGASSRSRRRSTKRSAWAAANRSGRSWCTSAPGATSGSTRSATSGWTISWRASPKPASPNGSAPSTRSSSCTTSGSTGKPKGIQHSTGGYLLWTILTMKWVFDYKARDVFWCTADVGWVTGHSYVCYGPLACGATTIMFEGVPTYPDAGRFWKMIQDHKVTVFYTAPTAIRSLIKAGGDLPKKYDLFAAHPRHRRRADQP
jgi:acetyl-CoA synthetase